MFCRNRLFPLALSAVFVAVAFIPACADDPKISDILKRPAKKAEPSVPYHAPARSKPVRSISTPAPAPSRRQQQVSRLRLQIHRLEQDIFSLNREKAKQERNLQDAIAVGGNRPEIESKLRGIKAQIAKKEDERRLARINLPQ